MINPLNFRSFSKFLARNKLYTAINIFGLSISLMFVILIATYTTQELSVDKFQKNRDRITTLGYYHFIGSQYGLSPYLLNRYPEIGCLFELNQFIDKNAVTAVVDNGDRKGDLSGALAQCQKRFLRQFVSVEHRHCYVQHRSGHGIAPLLECHFGRATSRARPACRIRYRSGLSCKGGVPRPCSAAAAPGALSGAGEALPRACRPCPRPRR